MLQRISRAGTLALCFSLGTASLDAKAEDLQKNYALLRDVVKDWMSKKNMNGFNTISKISPDENGDFYMRFCGTFSMLADVDPGRSWKDGEMMDIAGHALLYSYEAQSLGYPRSTWQGFVSDFETRMIHHLETSSKPMEAPRDGLDPYNQMVSSLADKLGQYREAHGNKLPRVIYSNMCGDADDARVGVFFKTSPPGGSASIIPSFFYDVCRKSGDPFDRNQCTFWRDTEPERKEFVRGTYVVHVRWSDGSMVASDRKDLRIVKEGDVVLLRKH